MEARGLTPDVWGPTDDLLRLLDSPGPFLTLHMTIDRRVENAASRNAVRWRDRRDGLAGEGVPEAVLGEVDALVAEVHHDGESLFVVANEAGILHAAAGPEPPAHELASWSPLPSLAPLIALRQGSPPYVTVVVDRTGADVSASGPDGQWEAEPGGATDPIRKVAAGGWYQRHIQERAENTGEHNAAEVAAVVSRLAGMVDARLIAVSGDERAVHLLTTDLPTELAPKVEVVDGSRGADGGPALDPDQLRRSLASVAASETVALLRKLHEELGQHDRAVAGRRDTLAALGRAQVQVLLVHDDPADEQQIWFGPEAAHLAMTEADLRSLGVEEPVQGRAVDVAIRAALGTGAQVRIVPSETVDGGMAGILRWA